MRETPLSACAWSSRFTPLWSAQVAITIRSPTCKQVSYRDADDIEAVAVLDVDHLTRLDPRLHSAD